MYSAVMVGKFVKQVVREWCPSTTGRCPPCLILCLHPAGRCSSSGTTTSAHANNKKGPKPREHVQLFHMKWDRNKGFFSEK